MVIMDKLVGDSGIQIDDASPISSSVLSTSDKADAVMIGKCFMKTVGNGVMTLVPVEDSTVVNNTFTCPFTGWWMLWFNWGHATGTASTSATYRLYYKKNKDAALVLFGTWHNQACLAHVPLLLTKGDTLTFTASAPIATFFEGTYCFEYRNFIGP
jgi:hypothetical protein